MSRIVKRAYRYRFHPTPEQAALLTRTFGCVRLVWNRALAERTRRYKDEGVSTSYVETAKWLTAWKQEPGLEFLKDVSNVPLQQVLRAQQVAFNSFFAKRARYPRFKSRKKSRASATFQNNAFSFRDGALKLAKMDAPLDIVWSRPLPEGAEPSTVTVSRDAAGRWFVSLLVEETIRPLDPVEQAVGVDAGITSLLTLSTGEKITNPKHERADRKRLARAQRTLARKAKGSANRVKARLKAARVHARITDRRRDFLHKLTTRLVRENQVIAVEDLTVRNMVKNHSLARAVSDASWRELRTMLEYKTAWYGRELLVVDRWFPSSKLCSTPGCGHVNGAMPLNVRSWTCPRCGTVHDRDVNAAKNILAAGLAER
ncbi:RNA-guided endonuclease InsQ/TnpB family protein [Planomonospora parontospora]|uniref:RNA-guided endonuclease InsQ/TnpB family protein n=1 Tax=Planomonospora parontospora TaxID=58119 RepID=UPI001670B304|nr:RNA-guided endonuclease TnpB family protein [Planomonospora parontospora]GGL25930.1 transposase [Planomonospora parontospora subsp. antibiotica]GII16049.1 transposase [Planomonospora parontospora subsp. antibiotica]